MALTLATQQDKSLSSNSTTTWDAYLPGGAQAPTYPLVLDALLPAV
jgi:hypothetical protein